MHAVLSAMWQNIGTRFRQASEKSMTSDNEIFRGFQGGGSSHTPYGNDKGNGKKGLSEAALYPNCIVAGSPLLFV